MIAPNIPSQQINRRPPINRAGMATWTDEEYRAICHSAGSRSRAAFIREELIDAKKLAGLVVKYLATKKTDEQN